MPLPPLQAEQTIELTVREEWGRLLSILVGSFGDIQLAEDVLQDAVTDALKLWRNDGLPNSPAAWLLTNAKRKAIDRFRREKRFNELQPEITYLQQLDQLKPDEQEAMQSIPDCRLELMFTCCHPAIERKSQVALTLRTIGGLTVDEIASAFLDKPAAIAKRLTRAKQKIAGAGIPYGVPDDAVLQQRITEILSVIYLVFNEGYSASTGRTITRTDLTDEAIRLARITYQLLPDHCESGGLLALMLLHDSRRMARQSSEGHMIPLDQQNRSLWNQARIDEGRTLIQSLLPRGQVGPYQLQAAISAVHTEAPEWEQTDWPQIAALYQLLYQMNPTQVIKLNHAVAVSYAISPAAALEMLDDLSKQTEMAGYQPYYAARADILERTGDSRGAQSALAKAIALSHNEAERVYLESRKALIAGSKGGCEHAAAEPPRDKNRP